MHIYTHTYTYAYVIFKKEMHNLTFSCLLSMKPYLIFLAWHFKTLRCHITDLWAPRTVVHQVTCAMLGIVAAGVNGIFTTGAVPEKPGHASA